jgi:ribA/ribD-fused uncharacterized protein
MIDRFQGQYRWLSNFWRVNVTLPHDSLLYTSVEHAYQAAKTNDHSKRRLIWSGTASRAKRIGRNVTMRPDWNAVKLDVMRDLIAQKFEPGTDLAEALIATGDLQLVEGNDWGDTYWGVYRGVGNNHLGVLLMARRKELT